MSQSTMSQSQAISQARREMEEIREEISFQHILLESIDDEVKDREKTEKDVRNEIRSLDRKLRDLRRKTAIAAALNPRSSSSSKQSLQATSPRSLSSNRATSRFHSGGDQGFAGRSGMNSFGQDQYRPLTSPSLTASVPLSNTNFPLSPSQTNLPSRKRSYSNHVNGQPAFVEDHKFRRTSQSPFDTAPPTPSTISSSDDSFEAFESSEYARRQEEAAAKLKQEKLDEELARSLNEAGFPEHMVDTVLNSMQPPARSGPNAFKRMSGAHQLSQPGPAYGASQRSSGIKDEAPGSSMSTFNPYQNTFRTNGLPNETSAGSRSRFSPYRSGPPSASKNEYSSFPVPGSFQDDSLSASDSELEIISSSEFRDNGRHSSSRPVGTMVNSFTVPQQSKSAHGNQPQHRLLNNRHGMSGKSVDGNGEPGSYDDMPGAFSMHGIPVYRSYGAVANAGPSLVPNVNLNGDLFARNSIGEPSDFMNPGAEPRKRSKICWRIFVQMPNSHPKTEKEPQKWDKEFRSKVKPQYRLSTHIVHGSGRKLSWDELRVYDVVLTTYGTLAAEFKRFQTLNDRNKLDGGVELDPILMKKTFPLLGPKSTFYRVILDEAQCIKNKSTGAARACCTLSAEYRFCLTGTPMMNSVLELYSLIHFLKIKPYNEWSRFHETFGVLIKVDAKLKISIVERDTKFAMKKLQALLKAILLRRTKKSQIDGKPIINLPEKTEEIQHVVFDEHEQEFYASLETTAKRAFNRFMNSGTVGKNYSNVLVMLLRLRQACCHPHLIQDFEQTPGANCDVSLEVMLDLARGLAPEVVARILESDGNFECPVCYDASLNPKIITPCGHDTCSECLAKISDQTVLQNVANGNEAARDSRCPFCRGAFIPSKVIDYTTFKKIHKPEAENPDDAETEDASDTDSDSSEDEFDSGSEADEKGNLKNFIVGDDTTEDEDADDEEEYADEEEGADEVGASNKAKFKGKGKEKTKRSRKSKGKRAEKTKHLSIAMLKKEASKTASGRRKYMKYLRKHWQPSAKLTKCVELLEKFRAENQKTIIFSQFVSLLDLLQVPIDDKGWECLRYDGGMSADARNNAVNQFTDSPTCKIMLISLKAGNAGLNLVAASRVIILDPFWNPYIEMQAVDRAYRIGQQHAVQVHRILIQATVEDRIIELQQQKRELVESALDENAAKGISRLGNQELAYLFGVGAR
ncbi:hypothetical protein JHW43_002737 [Diplocarpon mali]|nr:hypothetical protein JHW43_002737 [Diplocarpon mali]